MALTSELFTKEGPGKKRLADCAVSHQSNFFVGKPPLPGTEDAVERIQTALQSLGFSISDPAGVYGSSTAQAVFEFKSSRPKPILGPGQKVPDKVVGIQTIAALDTAIGGKSPGPTPPGPTPPAPKPPPPKPPAPKPPGPTPPSPKPPQPAPKALELPWPFELTFRADPQGVSTFKLLLEEPSRKREEFLTAVLPGFTNTLKTTVTSSAKGSLSFKPEITLDDIVGCSVGVKFAPLDGLHLEGTLAVLNLSGTIHTVAFKLKGLADPSPKQGELRVVAELQRNALIDQ